MFLFRRLALLVLCPLLSRGVAAQSAERVDPASCPYEACALRLSTRVFHGVGVQRGLHGRIEPLGFSGGALVRAVTGVPAAVVEAEAGRRNHLRGGVTTLIGTLASVSLVLIANREASSPSMRRNLFIGSGIGAAVSFYGGTQIARGDEHFSRAIWLFNQALPR